MSKKKAAQNPKARQKAVTGTKSKVTTAVTSKVKKLAKPKTALKAVSKTKEVKVKKESPVSLKAIKQTQAKEAPKKVTPPAPQENKIQKKSGLRAAQFILEPSKRKKIRKTKVIMEGELTINNVDTFMELINPIFKDYDFVDFFLREVTSLDLSHIQMLYYYQNHHIKKGKTVTIDADLKSDLKKIIVSAGFKELMFIPKLV
ncbi:MAG: hypothetical protein RIM99_09510 [Cyclobacteriaceae bacterium]